jgi:hypothetical protein
MVRGIHGIVQKWISQGDLCGLVNDKAGWTGLPVADMEMGHVHFVTRCQFLKDIVVTGWYRVVDVILSGNKEDLHVSQGLNFFISLD